MTLILARTSNHTFLIGLELVSTHSSTWCHRKWHSLATQMSYMYICHCLQV